MPFYVERREERKELSLGRRERTLKLHAGSRILNREKGGWAEPEFELARGKDFNAERRDARGETSFTTTLMTEGGEGGGGVSFLR